MGSRALQIYTVRCPCPACLKMQLKVLHSRSPVVHCIKRPFHLSASLYLWNVYLVAAVLTAASCRVCRCSRAIAPYWHLASRRAGPGRPPTPAVALPVTSVPPCRPPRHAPLPSASAAAPCRDLEAARGEGASAGRFLY